MKLNKAVNIVDEVLFVKSHQDRVRSGGVPRVIDPFVDRLNQYAKMKKIHLCDGCFEVLQDNVWKCPICGVNSQP